MSPPFLVGAIGASAGGVEACSYLLEAIPANAHLSLVIVLHLAREQTSYLPEILQKHAALEVINGTDGIKVRPGCVYVIRPDTQLTVSDGHLRVRPRAESVSGDYPINDLFRSIAEQYSTKSVGVVLTGAGHDGVKGLLEIRAAGGVAIAQDPEEAKVDSMPRAAIVNGAAELVLRTGEIAAELVRLSGHPLYTDQRDATGDVVAELASDAERLQDLFRLLRRGTGVDFAQYKMPTLHRRIQRRMALHHIPDLRTYLQFVHENPAEVQHLHEDILIHVTEFFREPESFDQFRATVFPEIVKGRHDDVPIRVWVPGCSSGEEAYSIAIALSEAIAEQGSSKRIQVFGTDVSERMVERARAGIYPESIVADVGRDRLQRYFDIYDGGYRVRSTIRERCVFARQDVTRDPPFSRLDIVLCRNVLIYLGQALQRKVIEMFHYALRPEGFLVLGRSETIGPNADLFGIVDARWKIYRRRPAVRGVPMDFGVPFVLPVAGEVSRPVHRSRPEVDLHQEAARVLLERYAPPMVIVDQDRKIVRSRGRTGLFLELPSGDISLDILRMARPGLLAPLRDALTECRETNGPARKEDLHLGVDDSRVVFNLEVTPLGAAPGRHYMVLFEQVSPAATAARPAQFASPAERAADPIVDDLQRELSDTQAHLHAMIQDLEAANEELQSANEEILSSNEELQSTNEELDTAREELQSTNEEVGTVNDELQSRNVDLSRANSDLVNLLGSVQIPIVMVGGDLKIRRFTPAAERLLNLISSDVGRPIGHIKPNIRFPELESLIREVVDTVVIHEREVTDHDGNIFLLTVRPYKSVDHRIDGAVLVLVDISSSLKFARETGEAIMSFAHDPILLLDCRQQLVHRANGAFCERFGVTREEVEGRSLYGLGGGRWNQPSLRRLFSEVLPESKHFENFTFEYGGQDGARTRLVLDGRRVDSTRRAEGLILLLIRESPA